MDSLDLLRSLTNGVNSKVSSNSSETEGVSYKVHTSLRGRKKGDLPISPSDDMKTVRDTYKEEIIEEEIIEEEIIEEEIIEEEIIDEEILEENNSESYNENSFNDDEPIFEIETDDVDFSYNNDFVEEIIEEVVEEEVVEEVIAEEFEDISEHVDIPVETTKNENEHKSEDTEVIINEPIINTSEKKKIDRCGNPFKRGPRNKNKEQKNKPSKVQQVLSELKEQEKLDKSDLVSNESIEEIDEVLVEKIEKVEEPKVVEPIIEEVSSDSEIEDMLLQSVFDELQDELGEIEEVKEDTEDLEEDIEDVEDLEEDILDEEEIEDISIEEEKEEPEPEPKKVEKVEKVVPKKVEKVAFEEVVFGEDVDFSFDDMDKKEEVSQIEDVNETDDKFKNCKYYGGMSVEEFLRENPNYREAMYVEYFYNKELLEELKMKGIILYKKGIYRL